MKTILATLESLINANTSFEISIINTIATDGVTQSIIIKLELIDEATAKDNNEEQRIAILFYDKNGYHSNDTICQFTSNFWGGGLYSIIKKKIGAICSHSTNENSSFFYKGFESLDDILEEYKKFLGIIKELLENEPKFKDFKLIE